MKLQIMYDPPSGWMYGFPRPYLPIKGEGLKDTLIRDGYPEALMNQDYITKYCRFFDSEVEEDHDEDNGC